MKIYLFNVENGLYEGETFEEPDMLEYEEGVTIIAPPLYEAGQVPVFDAEQDGWKVMPVSLVRDQFLGKKG
jgi:hypothetical protein